MRLHGQGYGEENLRQVQEQDWVQYGCLWQLFWVECVPDIISYILFFIWNEYLEN